MDEEGRVGRGSGRWIELASGGQLLLQRMFGDTEVDWIGVGGGEGGESGGGGAGAVVAAARKAMAQAWALCTPIEPAHTREPVWQATWCGKFNAP